MVAIFNQGVTVAGAKADQDSDRYHQFFYCPTTVNCILGETLKDFQVTYWGIGKPFFVQKGDRLDSVGGAILSGRAVIYITSEQRKLLVEQIRKVQSRY
ncbi:MAG: hypothetical protein ACHBN1_10910 [Heteroscytonema crispum UTEX LB 1556]